MEQFGSALSETLQEQQLYRQTPFLCHPTGTGAEERSELLIPVLERNWGSNPIIFSGHIPQSTPWELKPEVVCWARSQTYSLLSTQSIPAHPYIPGTPLALPCVPLQRKQSEVLCKHPASQYPYLICRTAGKVAHRGLRVRNILVSASIVILRSDRARLLAL